jgi:hypothetical protein
MTTYNMVLELEALLTEETTVLRPLLNRRNNDTMTTINLKEFFSLKGQGKKKEKFFFPTKKSSRNIRSCLSNKNFSTHSHWDTIHLFLLSFHLHLILTWVPYTTRNMRISEENFREKSLSSQTKFICREISTRNTYDMTVTNKV